MFYIMSCGYKEINSTFIHSISLGYAILTSIFYTKIFVIYLISVPFRNQFFYKLIANRLLINCILMFIHVCITI